MSCGDSVRTARFSVGFGIGLRVAYGRASAGPSAAAPPVSTQAPASPGGGRRFM